MTERIVMCMKWGTKYGADYVNRLYKMVHDNLSGEFRFVCLTDDVNGIRSDVECFSIPDMNLPEGIPERGWKKIAVFVPNLYDLQGTVLFLDLDIVIVDNIDEFFSYPGDFCIIHDWKRPWRITGNSSVYRFQLNKYTDILPYFTKNFEAIRKEFRNEQAYLSWFIDKHYGKLSYWPFAWCPSFKYHCIPFWPSNYWREPIKPKKSKIIIFHGEVNPPDALLGKRNRKFRFIKPASWINQYWQV